MVDAIKSAPKNIAKTGRSIKKAWKAEGPDRIEQVKTKVTKLFGQDTKLIPLLNYIQKKFEEYRHWSHKHPYLHIGLEVGLGLIGAAIAAFSTVSAGAVALVLGALMVIDSVAHRESTLKTATKAGAAVTTFFVINYTTVHHLLEKAPAVVEQVLHALFHVGGEKAALAATEKGAELAGTAAVGGSLALANSLKKPAASAKLPPDYTNYKNNMRGT